MKKVLLVAVAAAALALYCTLGDAAPAPGAEYYVATTGSDANAGTLAEPFATIQHAADVMEPGDTCYIRGGVYRETVDLSGVAVSYRLCGKGKAVLMRDCVTDAMDGLRFLKKHSERYGIDPNRIAVWGDSAGGHLAQMLTYAGPEAFPGDGSLAAYGVQPVCGISWYGPSDFTDAELFKTDLSDKNPDRFGERIAGTAFSYADNPKVFEEMSPYYWITRESPPLLLLQGDRDATIPLAHATYLKRKADRIGADVKMVIVKNAGHNWRAAGGTPTPGVEEIQRTTARFAVQHAISK